MKERPILFSAPMIQEIIRCRKTQTRRVIKPQPIHHEDDLSDYWEWNGDKRKFIVDASPYGLHGDRLWVRETWGYHLCCGEETEQVHYRADGDYCRTDGTEIKKKWRPSIHMPRAVSRIDLEITQVRVERLQSITKEDAKAEGSFLGRCDCPAMQTKPRSAMEAMFSQTGCHIHGTEFKALWDDINKKRGFGWEANPWVWVIEFRRVQ